MARMGVRIGIDTGGTFTDVVALDTATGRMATTKTPSTPANPAEAFVTGLRAGLELLGAGNEDLEGVVHGIYKLNSAEGDGPRAQLASCLSPASFIVGHLRQPKPASHHFRRVLAKHVPATVQRCHTEHVSREEHVFAWLNSCEYLVSYL